MIKLLTSIAGEAFSYTYGQVVKLDPKTEKALIESGQAEKVAEPKAEAEPKAKAQAKPKTTAKTKK